MSRKSGFVLNRNGVRQLMKSEEMQKVLDETAAKVLKNIDAKGYKKDKPYIGENRANVTVYADSYFAKKNNLKNNTLLKAISTVTNDD